jgi:hypothetical protein
LADGACRWWEDAMEHPRASAHLRRASSRPGATSSGPATDVGCPLAAAPVATQWRGVAKAMEWQGHQEVCAQPWVAVARSAEA